MGCKNPLAAALKLSALGPLTAPGLGVELPADPSAGDGERLLCAVRPRAVDLGACSPAAAANAGARRVMPARMVAAKSS